MANPPELDPRRKASEGPRHVRSLDWVRLLRAGLPEVALEEIGRWLGPEVLYLRLVSGEGGAVTIAEWPRAAVDAVAVERLQVGRSASEPRLVVGLAPGAAEREDLVERARMALEAWREARRELERAELRLTARSRELDLLQALGRRAAEAQTLPELFTTTVTALQTCVEFDVALAAHRGEAAVESYLYLTRPFDDAYLAALELRARRFLGDQGEKEQPAERIRLGDFDAARGAERRFREEDLVLLPLISRGQPAGCLLVVPASNLDERQLRLLYSAGNQLSLQMDRILSVRAAEAGRFRSIVDSMPQGVLLFEDGSRVSHTNRAAESMLESIGCSVGQTLKQILERLGDGSLESRLHTPRQAPSDVEVDVTGDRTWNLTLSPLHGDPRRPEGVVLVLADVTERRRIQQQLAQSEKMSSLGQMIAGVAHELNNPLASILGYAQLLRLRGAGEAQEDKLETLAREAERCRKIVQNLLSFGRRREPKREPLSLNQVVENVLALMRYQLRVDDVTLEHDLGRDLPVVRGDAHQLEQALVNLLTNARHAIGGTGAAGKVMVRTRVAAGGEVILEVEDDGPGVPQAQRSKIFDPFFTTKQDGKGTGLGLALVYGILSDHGGRIELREGTLGGARFVATFPVCGSGQTTDIPAEAPLPSPARTGRILIVDDEEPLARMIAEVLAADGHETRVVLDGRQALERLAEEPFDLIISDLKMPGMNGDQLYAEIRRLYPELPVSVLLTTGDTFEDDARAILDRTGLEVLSKPFDLDDLRRRVRCRLSERKPDA